MGQEKDPLFLGSIKSYNLCTPPACKYSPRSLASSGELRQLRQVSKNETINPNPAGQRRDRIILSISGLAEVGVPT